MLRCLDITAPPCIVEGLKTWRMPIALPNNNTLSVRRLRLSSHGLIGSYVSSSVQKPGSRKRPDHLRKLMRWSAKLLLDAENRTFLPPEIAATQRSIRRHVRRCLGLTNGTAIRLMRNFPLISDQSSRMSTLALAFFS
jgi:hypothetical protein